MSDDERAWEDRTACLGMDPEMFTVTLRASQGLPDSKAGRRRTRDAKRICAGCSVRQECFEEGVILDDRWTIRGGYTPTERKRLLSALRSTPTTNPGEQTA